MTPILDLAGEGVEAAVDAACRALSLPGAVVLVPTETVYGLVCRADDAAARQRIYDLKDRDATKPLGWGFPRNLPRNIARAPLRSLRPCRAAGRSDSGFRITRSCSLCCAGSAVRWHRRAQTTRGIRMR